MHTSTFTKHQQVRRLSVKVFTFYRIKLALQKASVEAVESKNTALSKFTAELTKLMSDPTSALALIYDRIDAQFNQINNENHGLYGTCLTMFSLHTDLKIALLTQEIRGISQDHYALLDEQADCATLNSFIAFTRHLHTLGAIFTNISLAWRKNIAEITLEDHKLFLLIRSILERYNSQRFLEIAQIYFHKNKIYAELELDPSFFSNPFGIWDKLNVAIALYITKSVVNLVTRGVAVNIERLNCLLNPENDLAFKKSELLGLVGSTDRAFYEFLAAYPFSDGLWDTINHELTKIRQYCRNRISGRVQQQDDNELRLSSERNIYLSLVPTRELWDWLNEQPWRNNTLEISNLPAGYLGPFHDARMRLYISPLISACRENDDLIRITTPFEEFRVGNPGPAPSLHTAAGFSI